MSDIITITPTAEETTNILSAINQIFTKPSDSMDKSFGSTDSTSIEVLKKKSGGASNSGGGSDNSGGGSDNSGGGSGNSGGGTDNAGGGSSNSGGGSSNAGGGAANAKVQFQEDVDKGTSDTTLYFFTEEKAKEFADLLMNVDDGKRYEPIPYNKNVKYTHRINCNEYNLRIGDCQFIVPPDFISVRTVSQTEKTVAIRQSSSLKNKYGYEQTEVTIDIYFNGTNQINGFEVSSPFDKPYYVDGLRSLLAQTKISPFVPVENEFLNLKNDIYTIAVQSISISTVPGFPKLLKATIIALNFNCAAYTGLPDWIFEDMIEWDLFRYNYQRFLTDISDSKIRSNDKLIKINKFDDDMTFWILDKDSIHISDKEEATLVTNVDNLKYTKYLNNKEDSFTVGKIEFGYSNILNTMQLAEHSSPTIQYLGGNDSVISIQIDTDDTGTVNKFKKLIIESQSIVREIKNMMGFGFLKIENSLFGLLGTNYLVIDDITISTVPDFPDKTLISINCVSYDIVSSLREGLQGFRPFSGDGKGVLDDAISQNSAGLINKIKQDTTAEKKIGEMSLYPDLSLPMYSEIDTVIAKINAFRDKNGIDKIGFNNYPKRNTNLRMDGKDYVYSKYLDPDFYMFYPFTMSGQTTGMNNFKTLKKPKPDAVDTTITYTNGFGGGTSDGGGSSGSWEDNGGGSPSDNATIQKYINVLQAQLGQGYVMGAEGQVCDLAYMRKTGANSKWLGKKVWDCSGFVYWGMKQVGIIPSSTPRGNHKSIFDKYCTKIQRSDLKPGDLLFNDSPGHVATYIGNGKTIEASNSRDGIVNGSWNWNHYTYFGRLKGLNSSSDSNNSNSTNTNSNSTSISIGKYSNPKYNAYDNFIDKYSRINGLNPNAIKAIIMIESAFNASAHNPSGATGLMQIMPGTASDSHCNIPFSMAKDAETNIKGGTKYFKYLKDKYNGSYTQSLQAYNWGPGNMDSYLSGKKSMPKETQNYVPKFNNEFKTLMANGGEDKEYVPGTGGVTDGNSTESSNTSDSTQKVSVTVAKKHSNKTADYTGKLGVPLTKESPINAIIKLGAPNVPNNTEDTTPSEPIMPATSVKVIETNFTWKKRLSMTNKPEYIVLHHAAANTCSVEEVHNWHTGKGYGGIGYHYFVRKDGSIYRGRPEGAVGAHTLKGYNYNSIGICAEGNFMTDKMPLVQVIAIGSLVKDIMIRKNITLSKIKLHKECDSSTECPGTNYPKSSILGVAQTTSDSSQTTTTTTTTATTAAYTTPEGSATEVEKIEDERKNLIDQFKLQPGSTGENDYPNYMLVDAVTYTHKGSLLRAFPTYCFVISDDTVDWADGRKLWNNYYPYKSVVSIQVTSDREQPVTVAKISVTNKSGTLQKMQDVDQFKKTVADDPDISNANKWMYKNFGFMVGSPTLTQCSVDAKNVLVNEMKLMAGARIHIRIGYGSDPLGLNVRFNGTITEMNAGEILEMVAQDDGVELINAVVSTEEKETNDFFHLQNEPGQIATQLLTSRTSWTNVINKAWGEASKYNIEHFGLFLGNNTRFSYQREYDLCKNLYQGRYDQQIFCSASLGYYNGTIKTKMFIYNKTPWDLMQVCAQTLPEFICRPVYHQFESRLFFGLPYWLYKYRYDIDSSGKVFEQAKSFSQYHIIDFNDILDNKIKCVNKRLTTNAIGMYTISNDMKSTPTIYSDKNIDWSKQKTKIVDTTLVQDRWGWDRLYYFFGDRSGKNLAINVSTSTLIDSFNKMYNGEVYVIGNPAIKTLDYIYMNDKFSDMHGAFQVRRVTETFSSDTGYITAITPDLIGYSKIKDAASSNVYRSMTYMLTAAATGFAIRYTSLNVLRTINTVVGFAKTVKNTETMVEIKKAIKEGKLVTNAVETLEKIKTVAMASEAFKKAENVAKAAKTVKSLKTLINTIKLTAVVGSDIVPIIGPIITFIITTIIFDTILESVIDFFSYNNCIGIRPLYYKNRPYVVNVKGQKDLIDGWAESNFPLDEQTE